jgi:hypothetical protein
MKLEVLKRVRVTPAPSPGEEGATLPSPPFWLILGTAALLPQSAPKAKCLKTGESLRD